MLGILLIFIVKNFNTLKIIKFYILLVPSISPKLGFPSAAAVRASAKRAPKTITNSNVPSESIFYKLSYFVLEIFLRGHTTEKIDFKW